MTKTTEAKKAHAIRLGSALRANPHPMTASKPDPRTLFKVWKANQLTDEDVILLRVSGSFGNKIGYRNSKTDEVFLLASGETYIAKAGHA